MLNGNDMDKLSMHKTSSGVLLLSNFMTKKIINNGLPILIIAAISSLFFSVTYASASRLYISSASVDAAKSAALNSPSNKLSDYLRSFIEKIDPDLEIDSVEYKINSSLFNNLRKKYLPFNARFFVADNIVIFPNTQMAMYIPNWSHAARYLNKEQYSLVRGGDLRSTNAYKYARKKQNELLNNLHNNCESEIDNLACLSENSYQMCMKVLSDTKICGGFSKEVDSRSTYWIPSQAYQGEIDADKNERIDSHASDLTSYRNFTRTCSTAPLVVKSKYFKYGENDEFSEHDVDFDGDFVFTFSRLDEGNENENSKIGSIKKIQFIDLNYLKTVFRDVIINLPNTNNTCENKIEISDLAFGLKDDDTYAGIALLEIGVRSCEVFKSHYSWYSVDIGIDYELWETSGDVSIVYEITHKTHRPNLGVLGDILDWPTGGLVRLVRDAIANKINNTVGQSVADVDREFQMSDSVEIETISEKKGKIVFAGLNDLNQEIRRKVPVVRFKTQDIESGFFYSGDEGDEIGMLLVEAAPAMNDSLCALRKRIFLYLTE